MQHSSIGCSLICCSHEQQGLPVRCYPGLCSSQMPQYICWLAIEFSGNGQSAGGTYHSHKHYAQPKQIPSWTCMRDQLHDIVDRQAS